MYLQKVDRSRSRRGRIGPRVQGFALVITVSLLLVLVVLAVGLTSLSSMALRSSSQDASQAEARSNARLALMLAIGELQKEMGPDMRVSAESAIFDGNSDTEVVEGVEQSRWLASYNSWGGWLNGSYQPPGGGGALTIGDTYGPRREAMFRRWLLSMPAGEESNVNAPISLSGWDNSNSVVLVGENSLGNAARADQITRAYLNPVGETGKYAWWISPENHKARIDMAKNPRTLGADAWQAAQANTAEVGVGVLDGFAELDQDASLGDKLITRQTLRAAQVGEGKLQQHFFDLTAESQGVLASVRTGHLKKDLSLLFERDNVERSLNKLPARYSFKSDEDKIEPSIRPMSGDLLAYRPKIENRHFQSWTNMRHFYRMYRRGSDSTNDGTKASGSLEWARSQPYSEAQVNLLYRDASNENQWLGDNAYQRLPLLAKLTFIYSLKTERVNPNDQNDNSYRLYLVYTPVFTYWNPYNVELRIPDNIMGSLSSTYQVLPMGMRFYLGDTPQNAGSSLFTGNAHSFLRSGSGSQPIVFKPGEIKLFSHQAISAQSGGQADPLSLMPGFDPMAYGGDMMRIGGNNTYTPRQRPGLLVQFSHSEWGGNVSYGNTPGSLCHTSFWLAEPSRRIDAYQWNIPVMYQNDWFNLEQTYTPITPPGTGNLTRWSFSDSSPVPVAYAQLVLKGLSEFDYESIDWARDWRSRNWIQAPPFYFGNSMYISEDTTTAHTQRLDNPYVMNFGPMSMGEMSKVVGHLGENAFLGSGSNPFEKVTAVPALELPTAPLGSIADFAGMRINPGWADPRIMNSDLRIESVGGHNTSKGSYNYALAKTMAYQSGVTGPGIGNSFIHPMLPRTAVYQYFNNSVSADPADRRYPLNNINFNDNKVFSDYWDHVFLLNDALWDDYFVSSLADQSRPGAGSAVSLNENIDRLVEGDEIANSRYRFHSGGGTAARIKSELQAEDGYLKAAGHLVVDGMFNVNSTSVPAWYALFAGIRERQLVFRGESGLLEQIEVPSGKRIAISRFNTPNTDQEMSDPEFGVERGDGARAWSDVRYLDDDQLRKLAEECVKQVKKRGPFLNFSEFINRRLSNDELGLMGALQSAIDYDDASPDPGSINYRFKNGPDFMFDRSALGRTAFQTPEALAGSRFAGIPGYVIQSDLLKPIANTLSVRDDTFKIRAYGEALDASGKILARAWCEATVQRVPEYCDPENDPSVAARELNASGDFNDNPGLTSTNRQFGRYFEIQSFRWLNKQDI